jgi:hypothetical protein
MHQTTIRFAPDVWQSIEHEARVLGISAAQYVRDAALSRLAYGAARRADPQALDALAPDESRSSAAQAVSQGVLEGSEAVWAQARMARTRARATRDTAHKLLHTRRAS